MWIVEKPIFPCYDKKFFSTSIVERKMDFHRLEAMKKWKVGNPQKVFHFPHSTWKTETGRFVTAYC